MDIKLSIGLIASSLSLSAMAADLSSFPPTSTAWGSISPPDISSANISSGSEKLYRAWFDNITFEGDLLEHSLASNGAVTSTASWSAKTLLDARSYSDRIAFKGSDGSYDICATTSSDYEKFLCGDNTNEAAQGGSGAYRDRSSKLGTIVHSNPVYVGKPKARYTFDSYLSFASANANRSPRIYAGANDGMLHSFDTTGKEIFAFIPSAVESSLSTWSGVGENGNHAYFVDGPLVVGDAHHSSFSGSTKWKSILIGGLGAGGKAYFALDVTTPMTSATAFSTIAGTKLWEFAPSGMGYTYGAPLIARTNASASNWALIAPNGYQAGGEPILYIRDINNPATVLKDFDNLLTPASAPTGNGLSSPTGIDLDGDDKIDYVYAGDLDGNLWRFDLTNTTASSWSATKLFSATDGSNAQPIVSAPEVTKLTETTVMVYFGTGDAHALSSSSSQSFYALKDTPAASVASSYTRSDLAARSLSATSNSNYKTINESSSPNDVAVDWSSQQGWYMDLGTNEHVLQRPVLNDSRIQFMAHNLSSGDNWLVHLEYKDGRLPDEVTFDLNGDEQLTAVYDNIDYVDASNQGDIVTGMRISADLASGPSLAEKDSTAISYLNLWDAGMAGSPGTTTTTTTYATSSCSVMTFSRIRVDDDDVNVTFTVKAATSEGDIQASVTVDPEEEDTNARSPGLGSYPASAGAGSGVDTSTGSTQNWFGLELEVLADTIGSNDTRLQVTYHGPFRTNGFTLSSTSKMHRLDDEDSYAIKTCRCTSVDYTNKSCSGCSSCNQRTSRYDYSSSKSSVSYSGTSWSDLNSTSSYNPTSTTTTTTGATTATAASGNQDAQVQSGDSSATGRIRWRELTF